MNKPEPFNLSSAAQPYYIAGTLIGTILAGLKGSFNLMEYENADRKKREAERKEGGFYKIEENEEELIK